MFSESFDSRTVLLSVPFDQTPIGLPSSDRHHTNAQRCSSAFFPSSAILTTNGQNSDAPIGLIAGTVVGFLFLLAVCGVIVSVIRHKLRDEGQISDSPDVDGDLDLPNSTLHETFITFADSITIEGVRPVTCFTLAPDGSEHQSLIDD
jgi:hypothetical protein